MPIDARHPREIRRDIRNGKLTGITAGLGANHVQANLAVLPKGYAYDFLLFCQRNPKPCPLLEVTDPGSPHPGRVARGADLRTDLPQYRIFRHGAPADEVRRITDLWREDFVAFLLGCSFTFEAAMQRAGIPVRHLDERRNVPMYISSVMCRPAGTFAGPMVVSMRPVPAGLISQTVQVTARSPLAHGAPIHIGDPAEIGIHDLSR